MSPSFLKPSKWALDQRESKFGPSLNWSNEDMDPVAKEGRTWTTWDYVAYWISGATNASTWQFSGSILAVGLSWRQALSTIALGNTIISVVLVLNGTIGARLHIAFPVLNRSSFGFWFSYFSVVSRVVLAMFWFGVLTFTGSECVYQMLKAIWPATASISNHLAPTANITSAGLMCYLIYWLIQLPLMLVSPQQIRHFFTVKAIIIPAAWLAILIWSIVQVPTKTSLASAHTNLHGTALTWAWLSALNNSLGGYSTLSVNIPDFTRYARDEKSQYIQLIIMPAALTLVSFIGIAVTSAGETLYGEVIWDPLRMIDKWDNRAAAFFAAFSFLLGTLGTNISSNSLSAANDMTALLPRYINIRRGQVICAVVGGWALCPWEILATAPGFLSFISGYSIFLGPFAGIMVSDYWVVHRGKVDVPAMYDPHGRYRYSYGTNWRAVVALIVTIAPGLPGLINVMNPRIFVGQISYLFDVAWMFGFFGAFGVYTILSLAFPAKGTFVDEPLLGDDISPDYSAGASSSHPHEELIT